MGATTTTGSLGATSATGNVVGIVVVVVVGICVQGFETSSSWRTIRLGCVTDVKVGLRVLTNVGIGSFGSWNKETTIVLRSKYVHISLVILTTKSPYFYKACRLRF